MQLLQNYFKGVLMENQSGEEVLQGEGASVKVSDKSWVMALGLVFFLGIFGVHRFYLGRNVSGGIMLVCTVIGFLTLIPLIFTGLWAFVDFIRIIIGSLKDSNGLPLAK
jgi:TM2 domain-containing membrane protein YozV